MKHSGKKILGLCAVLAAVFWLQGCDRKTKQAITFSAQNVGAGETIVIDAGQDVFDKEGSASVFFDSSKADIVRMVSAHEAEVMVPAGISGKVTVRIEARGKQLEPQAFEVARPASQKLMLSYEGGQVKMVGKMATGAEFRQNTASRDRVVVYKVYDDKGTLLAQGVTDQPVGNMEVFQTPQGQVTREPRMAMDMGAVPFSITIPNYQGAIRVRFFEGENTEETLSLQNDRGLKQLNEITLENR